MVLQTEKKEDLVFDQALIKLSRSQTNRYSIACAGLNRSFLTLNRQLQRQLGPFPGIHPPIPRREAEGHDLSDLQV